MNDVAELFLRMLHAATNAHLLHLQSKSFAQHMALDTLYKELPGMVDDLVEAYQGKNSLITSYPALYNLPDSDPIEFVKGELNYFTGKRDVLGTDTELQNLADNIAELFDSTLYKLRFLS